MLDRVSLQIFMIHDGECESRKTFQRILFEGNCKTSKEMTMKMMRLCGHDQEVLTNSLCWSLTSASGYTANPLPVARLTVNKVRRDIIIFEFSQLNV